jgi:hypothetical protein
MDNRELAFTDLFDKVEYEGDLLYVLENWPSYIARIEQFEPELASDMKALIGDYSKLQQILNVISEEIGYKPE